jgi:hypothetical protein
VKTKCLIALTLVLGAFTISVPLFAHHGDAAFDTTAKKITIKGTVTAWIWANPHCLLQFDALDDSGQVAHWVAETTAPPSLINRGWTSKSFKPGDQVTITLLPVKNGKPIGRLVSVVFPDGQKLPRGNAAE